VVRRGFSHQETGALNPDRQVLVLDLGYGMLADLTLLIRNCVLYQESIEARRPGGRMRTRHVQLGKLAVHLKQGL